MCLVRFRGSAYDAACFDFRTNRFKHFDADGVDFQVTDAERAEAMLIGVAAKRLNYQQLGP